MTRAQAFAESFWRHAGTTDSAKAKRVTRYTIQVASFGLWNLLRLAGRAR